jgi:hypothetical protein
VYAVAGIIGAAGNSGKELGVMSSKKKNKNRVMFAWICGYGLGIVQSSLLDLSNPKIRLLSLFVGLLIAGSALLWDYLLKPGGGIDKMTDRRIARLDTIIDESWRDAIKRSNVVSLRDRQKEKV